jgi:uncharacterized membrane protein YoaK (UPF0700 family)
MKERLEQAAPENGSLKDVETGSSATVIATTDTDTSTSDQQEVLQPTTGIQHIMSRGSSSSSSSICEALNDTPHENEVDVKEEIRPTSEPMGGILRQSQQGGGSASSIKPRDKLQSVSFDVMEADEKHPRARTAFVDGDVDYLKEESIRAPDDKMGRIDPGGSSSSLSLSSRLSRVVEKASTSCFSKLFGETYTKREGVIVLMAGALLAFNSGFVNGSTLSGFLTPTRKESVSAYTTSYSLSAMAVARGDTSEFGYYSCFVLSYLFGSFLAGLITPNGTPFQIEPTYGPTFLIGGVFLMTASILAAIESEPSYIFFLCAAANGIQNGIASIYSANLIRCSLTGASTDVALVIAQCVRGNRKQLMKGLVLMSIILCFWLGGFLSFYMTRRFLTHTLFFNAVLFWLIGLGLVYFLVHELDITVRAAISGTWQWKQAIGSLQESFRQRSGSGDDCKQLSKQSLYEMFDEIDDDHNGEIEPEELLDALLKANATINAKGVMVLIKKADSNGDGMINRKEWRQIVQKMEVP